MRISVSLSTLTLLAGVTAQTTTIPSMVTTVRPTITPYWTANVFFSTTSTTTPHDSRSQSIVEVSDIAAPAAVWTSLSVRRPVGLGNVCPITTTNVSIQMSVSTTGGLSATSSFATNHGGSPVTVFTGQVNLPQRSSTNPWPMAWEAPIPFSTPFGYAGIPGGSLVLDILQTGNTATTAWYLEATPPDNGSLATTYFTGSCRFSNGNPANGVSYSSIILPGRSWGPTYSNLLPNAPGIAFIGAYGPGGTWNGVPLPLDLGPFGAPNCIMSSSIEIVQALVASATGSATWAPAILIPNDPALAGTDFHTHSLWVDPLANALGLVTGYGGRWHIGTGLGAPGSFVSATGAAAMNATGTLQRSFLPSFQLN